MELSISKIKNLPPKRNYFHTNNVKYGRNTSHGANKQFREIFLLKPKSVSNFVTRF